MVRTIGAGTQTVITDRDTTTDAPLSVALLALGENVLLFNFSIETGITDGIDRWDVGFMIPASRRCGAYNTQIIGRFRRHGLLLDATWSATNTTLTELHPDINSTSMNEFTADKCLFSGHNAASIYGTTRDPDNFTAQTWVWSPGGTSDINFSNCEFRSDGPGSQTAIDGSCFRSDAAIRNAAKAGQEHRFVNCSFRARSKYIIFLDRSNRDKFCNCYSETVESYMDSRGQAAYDNTANTGGVSFVSCRLFADFTNWDFSFTDVFGDVNHRGTSRNICRSGGGFNAGAGNIINDSGSLTVSSVGSLTIATGGGNVLQALSAAGTVTVSRGNLFAGMDNTQTCGGASARWSEVFAGNAAINTSDEREKHISIIPDAWLTAANNIHQIRYKWKDGGNRWHIGYGAQSVYKACKEAGIDDPWEISFLCRDVLTKEKDDGQQVPLIDEETGEPLDRWSLRVEELNTLKLAAIESGFN